MTGIIILAAGSSSRLGTPKQNLIYQGKTLLQRAIETAIASVAEPVIAVLGANTEVIKPSIEDLKVKIVHNEDWQEGMASSVRLGISALKENEPAVNDVILMLCDQPFIDTYILNFLILSKSKSGIVACSYNNTIGPPALFDAVYFDELLALKGQEGAKKILTKYAHIASIVPFEKGSIDIDTIDDFNQLKV